MKLTKNRDLKRLRREAFRPHPVADQLMAQSVQRYGAGVLPEALELAQQVLRHRPGRPDALNIIAAVKADLGDQGGAVAALTQAVEVAPEISALRVNLSLALRRAHRAKDAVVHAREAVRLDPANPTAHDALCASLAAIGDLAGAVVAGREAVRLAPAMAGAWVNLANALLDSGFEAEAERAYREAVRIGPTEADAWSALGRLYLKDARYDDAMTAFRRALELRRATEWWPHPGAGPVRHPAMPQPTNTIKLRHEIEQLEHLRRVNRLPPGADRLLPAYEEALAAFLAAHDPNANGLFPAREWETLGPSYSRVVLWDPPAALPRTALGAFDRGAVAERYAQPPGITWVDDLLATEAVAALRKFCLEATIWNDIAHNFQAEPIARAYLGTYVSDGFCAPLLFQVADELIRALPAIFKHHRLRQMWAYKYEADLQGIGIHGDDAAVNVNFWITPDEANLDPDGGGLLVYPVEAPREWSFKEMNADPDRMWRFIEDSGRPPVNVPYRQNRAVIFNSDLFHATAPLHFKPGYENRRINITMLFGRRGE